MKIKLVWNIFSLWGSENINKNLESGIVFFKPVVYNYSILNINFFVSKFVYSECYILYYYYDWQKDRALYA